MKTRPARTDLPQDGRTARAGRGFSVRGQKEQNKEEGTAYGGENRIKKTPAGRRTSLSKREGVAGSLSGRTDHRQYEKEKACSNALCIRYIKYLMVGTIQAEYVSCVNDFTSICEESGKEL